MATLNQIEANRRNATLSTGPRTEAGLETSSRNHFTQGLYTRQDYVKPEERELYKDFCEGHLAELAPEGFLETTLASEIIGAAWRLRRCSAAEGTLADYATQDPLLDDSTEKNRRSIDRARASANAQFHRALNQLRKLQTERAVRLATHGHDLPGLAESHKVEAARKKSAPPPQPEPEEPGFDEFIRRDLNRYNVFRSAKTELASNCEAAEVPELPLEFDSLDEAGQLQLLAERREIEEQYLAGAFEDAA
jgi:hypothetical protein